MPSFKTHAFLAVLAYFLIVWYSPIKQYYALQDVQVLLGGLIAFLYGTLPDLDSRSSKWQNTAEVGIGLLGGSFLLAFVFFKQDLLFILIGFLLFALLFFINTLNHRGSNSLHRILMAVVLSSPLLFLSQFYFLAGFGAFVFHMLLDSELRL